MQSVHTSPKHLSSPSAATVAMSSSSLTIRRFRKELMQSYSLNHPPSCRKEGQDQKLKLIWSGLTSQFKPFIDCFSNQFLCLKQSQGRTLHCEGSCSSIVQSAFKARQTSIIVALAIYLVRVSVGVLLDSPNLVQIVCECGMKEKEHFVAPIEGYWVFFVRVDMLSSGGLFSR